MVYSTVLGVAGHTSHGTRPTTPQRPQQLRHLPPPATVAVHITDSASMDQTYQKCLGRHRLMDHLFRMSCGR